jgi:hypothetical protein
MYYLQRFGARYVYPFRGFPTLYHLPQVKPVGPITRGRYALPPLAGWGIRPPSHIQRATLHYRLH